MNKNSIKKFAIESRVWLRGKIEAKLGELGISKGGIGGAYQQTDTEVKATELSTKAVSRVQYESLRKYAMGLKKSYSDSWYDELIEECAYTWFNRVIGIKYMEINGYLPDKINVLTSSTGKVETDIMINFEYLSFADRLDKEFIRNGLLDHKTEEVFRYIFLEQNHELSKVMPFMFKSENDFSDLIFPDGMLGDNGIVSKINTMIESEDWKEIEIIGWLYQFYNSEKKDEVFEGLAKNKKITKENIPAATQLFTPKWIVKYMVENSLGKLALEDIGINEKIKENWKYYIDNPNTTTNPITIKEREQIKIEEVKVLDPSMGSGHILVYAFDVLYQIYEELGYGKKEAVISILNNNLYGMDIDDRAAQLASFALIMKGREYYARIFSAIESGDIKYNAIAIQESNTIDESVIHIMESNGLNNIAKVVTLFEDAKEYGSILNVEGIEIDKLEDEKKKLQEKDSLGFSSYKENLNILIKQANLMQNKYEVVVTNPPYMGGKGMSVKLSEFVKKNYPDSKSDLFAVFMEKCGSFTAKDRYTAMIVMPSWLFLSSFEKLRLKLIETKEIESLLHMGRGIFGIDWGSVAFILKNKYSDNNKGSYFRLHKRNFQHILYEDIEKLFLYSKNNEEYKYDFDLYRDEGGTNEIPENGLETGQKIKYTASQADFEKIPGSPIAYWVSDRVKEIFEKSGRLGDLGDARLGMATADNNKFLRFWSEISVNKTKMDSRDSQEALESGKKWFPYNKGGDYRKWYGNNDYIVNWENNGDEIRNYKDEKGKVRSHNYNLDFIFKEGVTWSALSSSEFSVRYSEKGFLFDNAGSSLFANGINKYCCFVMNIKKVKDFLLLINPTLNFQPGNIASLPIIFPKDEFTKTTIDTLTQSCIDISRAEWDSRETSWDFKVNPLIEFVNSENNQIETSYNMWCKYALNQFIQLHKNEEELNRLFIDIYGLQDEMTPDVDFGDITLFKKELKDRTGLVGAESISARNDKQQSARNDENHWADMESAPTGITKHFDKSEIMKQFISYAVGCNMGRYSIDKEGLIIANSDDKLIVGADSISAQNTDSISAQNTDSISAQNTESISAQNTPTITITGADGEIRHEITNARYIPDSDAIVPITDTNYFAGEDILERFEEFLAVTYGADTLEENLNFIANGIKESKNPARAVLRDYFMGDFMADHIKRYSSRPIYWMVSSNGKGKGAAFNALIYLHRYNKNTIPAIRGKYVNELQAKLNSKLEFADKKLLEDGLSTKEKNELKTEREKYRKQINELLEFDKKLNALANQNIELDLDDGVKVNYKKLDGILYKIKFSGD